MIEDKLYKSVRSLLKEIDELIDVIKKMIDKDK